MKNEEMKSGSRTVILCMMCLIVLFCFFQMNLSSIFTILAMDSKRDQETKIVARNAMSHVDKEAQPRVKSARQISCDRFHRNYDVCSFNGPTVFDPTESTLFLMGITDEGQEPILEEKVRPYPRKWDNFTMAQIKEVTLTSGPLSPPCLINHNAPALVFSAGGYTDNFAYDFNDVFIPLFITVNSIFPSQEFIVAIFNSHDWWLSKYENLLRSFTQHPIINFDKEPVPHCFPSATVGLISHGFMTIDPKLMPSPKTFKQFRALLKSTYSPNGTSISKPPTARPRLVLVSNGGGVGCAILNQAEVVLVAEEVGFKAIVFKPTSSTPLRESYNLINSSHAMVGLHGAALTHLVFLRPGSVFMEIVPIGVDLVSELCLGRLAKDLALEYMEYKIEAGESTLIERYEKDGIVLKDPNAIQQKDCSEEIMNICLKGQNVKLDMVRLGKYFKKAYEKAKIFMDKEG